MSRYIHYFLLLIAIQSCQSPSPIETFPEGESTATISVKIAGSELTSQSSSDDIIAIQIYSYDQSGVKSAYAYGLYDNFAIGDIVLVKDTEYLIDATYICNAKNRLSSTSAGKYYEPFKLYPNFTTAVTNSLVVNSYYFYGLLSGESYIKDGSVSTLYSRALLERYAGSTGVFTANDDTQISLSLLRVYSTIRLSAEGLDSGTFSLEIEGCEPISYSVEQGTTDFIVAQCGTTPSSIEWTADEYSEEAEYWLYYDNGSSEMQAISSGTLELVRSTILPINIKFNSTNIALDIEDVEMEVLTPVEIEI